MILIGRGLDFRYDPETNGKQTNGHESWSCAVVRMRCIPRAPEEEDKDDGRGRSFQLELKRKNQPKQPNEQAPIRSAPVEVDI